MQVYIIFFLFCLTIVFLSDKTIRSKNYAVSNNGNFGLFIIFVLIFFISAFRYNVGTDYIVYQTHANKIMSLSFAEAVKDFEIFFILLVYISQLLTGSMQLFYIVTAFVFLLFLFKGIKFHTNSYFLPLLLFFLTTSFFMSLNIMRQMTSFAIGLYSIKFLYEKKQKTFWILLLLAFLFHKSSVLFAIFPLLTKKDITKFAISGAVITAALNKLLNTFMVNFLIDNGLPFSYYFNLQEEYSSLSLIIISGLIFFSGHYLTYKNQSVLLYNNINYLIFVLSIFANGVPGGYRFVYVLWPFYIVTCPIIITNSLVRPRFVLTFLYLIIFFSFFYKNQIMGNSSEVVPYNTIFHDIFTLSNDNITNPIHFT